MIDFVFNLCCSKRQKQEGLPPNPDRMEQEDSPQFQSSSDFVFFLDQKRKKGEKQNKEMVRQESQSCIQDIPQKSEGYPMQLSMSLQHQVDHQLQNDHFLLLGDPHYQGSHQAQNSLEIQKYGGLEEYFKQAPVPSEIRNLDDPRHITSVEQSGSVSQIVEGIGKKIRKKRSDGQSKRNVKLWDSNEDALLKKHYKEQNGNWQKIALMIPGRNISQCSQRWRRMNPIIACQCKQKWSSQEDQKVLQLVKSNGKNWGLIAKELIGRSGKQIRERYLNKLDPNLKLDQWTQEEDENLLQMYNTMGTKWSKIAAQLNGRSENMVKNRFYTYIKRVLLGETNRYQIIYNTNDSKQRIKNLLEDQDNCSEGQRNHNSEHNTVYRYEKYSFQEQSVGSSSSQVEMYNLDPFMQDEEDQFNQFGLYRVPTLDDDLQGFQ